MKNFCCFISIIVALSLSSCHNNIIEEEDDFRIWDFNPLSIEYVVIDKSTGDNLLDPETPGNILANDITCEYNGEIYEIFNRDEPIDFPVYDKAGPSSRAILPVNLGLRYVYGNNWVPDEENGEYKMAPLFRLFFGEFDTCADLHNQEVVVNWGDGTSNKIVFNCYIEWIDKDNPKVHHEIWLDDVRVDGYRCIIYK